MLRRLAPFALFAVLVVLPLYALAQTGDPTIDAILAYVPPKMIPVVLAGWAALFYVVAPLVLRFVQVTPESRTVARWAVKIAEFVTQNTHRPPPLSSAPKGYARVGTSLFLFAAVAFLLAVLVMIPGRARADDPQFGACWDNGICVGPRVAAPALQIDLKTGSVQAGVLPGFGYGIEKVSHKIPWGFSLFANVKTTGDGDKFTPAVMFDFFRYIHVGAGFQIGGHAYGLLTLGTDLGGAATPEAAAAPAK